MSPICWQLIGTILVFLGNRSRHSDEACSQHFFSNSAQPVKYLIPEGTSEDCPFLGRFEEIHEPLRSSQQQQQQQTDPANSNRGNSFHQMVFDNFILHCSILFYNFFDLPENSGAIGIIYLYIFY